MSNSIVKVDPVSDSQDTMERLEEVRKPPPIRTTSPALAGFLLYAERSIRLGERCFASGGDIGIHAIADSSYGTQAHIGSESVIDPCRNIYAPSICLGRDVVLGIIQTDHLEDDTLTLGSPVPFPAATMPPPLLAPAPGGPGADVTVAAGEITALLPGNFGRVTVIGTLLLNPGTYSFASATLTDGARLVAIAGTVHVRVRDALTAGRRVRIFPAFHRPANQFVISVSGRDGAASRPAASFGEHGRIRALVAVPHGTLTIADNTHLTGAFAAFDLVAGKEVHAEFQSGFPAETTGQRGSQPLQGYYGPNPDPSVASLAGPVPADTVVPLAIGLPVRDPDGLKTFIKQVTDPKNSNFRKFLTPAHFTANYGATDVDYSALKNWATANGLSTYATFPNNLLLCVSGTAEQIEQALYVNLVYRLGADGEKFVAVDREPSLDLAVPILRVNGLAEFRTPRHAAVQRTGGCSGPGSGNPGRSCGDSYRAADIRNAYLGSDPNIMKLDGTGQVVGLLELNSYSQSDITGYDALQIPPLNSANVVLYTIAAPPPFTSYQPNNETVLDIEMVQAIAPGAQILIFQTALGVTLHGDAVFHAMATSNPPLTSASCSYVFGRSDNSEQALEQMAAQGVSFFTASGDFGDIGDPQSNLNMPTQTLVGGTILATNSLSNPFPTPAYPNPYYAGESTWNQTPAPQQKGVTGGGIMDGNNQNGQCYCWPYSLGPVSCCGSGVLIPDWQVGIMAISAGANGGSVTWRNYPDVAMLAANVEIVYNGGTAIIGGTSAAAPLWAGFTALINQRIKQLDANAGLAGFLNPTLYDIGLTRGSDNDLYVVCFNDIADNGSNANGFGPGFKSVPGYDLCTGLGSPKVGLIYQISSPTPLTPNQPFALIRFVIGSGKDGCGGGLHGSDQTVDILLQDSTSFTCTLRHRTESNWDAWSSHTLDFQIPDTINYPLTESQGIAGVRINLVQNNPDVSADNWDITSIAVSLFNPPFSAATSVCQLDLTGTATLQDGSTGLIRLSKSAGDSGNGPSSPVYTTGLGSGCP
jgi:Pro-kumamolisin, activation domain/Subtilase family